MTTWTRELSTGSTSTASTPLTVGNLKLDGNTISTEDANGSMTFDTNGTGKYIFNHDGGGAQAIHIVCSDSDGGFLHFMNSTTGTTGDTDGWKIGIDASENLLFHNEETNKNPIWINDGTDKVNMPVGLLDVGENTTTRGVLQLWDGAGGNTPGYLVLYSRNGTANYIFCEDDGTLKRHTSVPAANSDGSEIGGQT